ncbi:MAG: hypothetical protein AAGI88_16020 [Pseudomonadota bacterium]
MTMTSDQRVWTGLMLVFPVSFLISLPWLKEQPQAVVHLFGGIAATGTVVSSFILAVLKDQNLDEWHRGAARFSNQWGWLAGGGLVAILQGIPAFRHLVSSTTSSIAENAGASDQQILFAFLLGFMVVILAQMLCIVLLNHGWRVWMSREAS